MLAEWRRGALAGLVGGAALAAVLLLAGESPIQQAIDQEPAGGEALVSRAGQRIGGVLAALLVGMALGIILAVAVGAVRRRRAGAGDDGWRICLRVAAVAFATLHLVPFLKYPANPPGVGDPDAVAQRTTLYLLLLGWSLLSAWAASRAWRWLAARDVPRHYAAPAVAAVVVALIGFALVVLPPGPDPDAIPASVVWNLRVASLAGWAAFWAVAGTVMGWLQLPEADRALRRPAAASNHVENSV